MENGLLKDDLLGCFIDVQIIFQKYSLGVYIHTR